MKKQSTLESIEKGLIGGWEKGPHGYQNRVPWRSGIGQMHDDGQGAGWRRMWRVLSAEQGGARQALAAAPHQHHGLARGQHIGASQGPEPAQGRMAKQSWLWDQHAMDRQRLSQPGQGPEAALFWLQVRQGNGAVGAGRRRSAALWHARRRVAEGRASQRRLVCRPPGPVQRATGGVPLQGWVRDRTCPY